MAMRFSLASMKYRLTPVHSYLDSTHHVRSIAVANFQVVVCAVVIAKNEEGMYVSKSVSDVLVKTKLSGEP
jgi:hypothetical protein